MKHICPTCGVSFDGADERFCPACHAREHAGSPLGNEYRYERKSLNDLSCVNCGRGAAIFHEPLTGRCLQADTEGKQS